MLEIFIFWIYFKSPSISNTSETGWKDTKFRNNLIDCSDFVIAFRQINEAIHKVIHITYKTEFYRFHCAHDALNIKMSFYVIDASNRLLNIAYMIYDMALKSFNVETENAMCPGPHMFMSIDFSQINVAMSNKRLNVKIMKLNVLRCLFYRRVFFPGFFLLDNAVNNMEMMSHVPIKIKFENGTVTKH